MADSSEGLNPAPNDEKARQTLRQLRNRMWPRQERTFGAPDKFGQPIGPPELIRFDVMNVAEVWQRTGNPHGEDTVYVLDRGAT